VWVVACELADTAAVEVGFVLANPNASAVGLVLPTIVYGREASQLGDFQEAFETPARGLVEVESTRCGPGPGTRLKLEPGQSVTRSVVFPIGRWERGAPMESTVKWQWRQFNLARPYEETPIWGCTSVALAVERGRCILNAERRVRCPRAGAIDVDLEQSEAEPPAANWPASRPALP
jgi:hypothetical protein